MQYEVKSEIVARIISVSVEPGQVVNLGDELMLLESMKMEIPVLADAPGKLTSVRVTVGDVVAEGDPLVALERSPDPGCRTNRKLER